MKILAVDTASPVSGVALSDNGMLKYEYTADHGRTHAVKLPGMIDCMLRESGWRIGDIDGFAVSVGPGSFTGLRIGISTVKGLAFAGEKPVAPVSTHDALANQCAGLDTLVCTLVDARKKEVYAALYRQESGRMNAVDPPRVAAPDAVLADIGETCFFIGSGALLYRKAIENTLGRKARIAPEEMNILRASTIARLGHAALAAGAGRSPHEVIPVYIRRPDAEKAVSAP